MKAIFLLPVTLLLSGCFFVMIPGQVIDGVSDAITGAEGRHCVPAGAKVGDRVDLSFNEIGVIKSLSGESMRCTDPRLPIRALIDVQTAATGKRCSTRVNDGQVTEECY